MGRAGRPRQPAAGSRGEQISSAGGSRENRGVGAGETAAGTPASGCHRRLWLPRVTGCGARGGAERGVCYGNGDSHKCVLRRGFLLLPSGSAQSLLLIPPYVLLCHNPTGLRNAAWCFLCLKAARGWLWHAADLSSCLLGTSDPPDTARLRQHAPAPQPACAGVPSWRPGTGGVRASAAL